MPERTPKSLGRIGRAARCVLRQAATFVWCAVAVYFVLLWSSRADAAPACIRGIKDPRGTRVVVSGESGCQLDRVLRDFPQIDPTTGKPYPKLIQERSIFAANLAKKADGTYQRHGVLRGCDVHGQANPDAIEEERKACKGFAFYYALAGVEFIVPQERAFTPSEIAGQEAKIKATEAEQDRILSQAADFDQERRKFKERIFDLTMERDTARLEAADKADQLATLATVAWRAKLFGPGLGVIGASVLLGAIGIIATWRARRLLQPLVAHGYGYDSPQDAVRDLEIRLSALKEDAACVAQSHQTEQAECAKRSQIDRQTIERLEAALKRAEEERAAIQREMAHKSSTLTTLEAELHRIRNADKRVPEDEQAQAYTNLLSAWTELDEEHKELLVTLRFKEDQLARQARQLSEQAEKIEGQEQELARLRATSPYGDLAPVSFESEERFFSFYDKARSEIKAYREGFQELESLVTGQPAYHEGTPHETLISSVVSLLRQHINMLKGVSGTKTAGYSTHPPKPSNSDIFRIKEVANGPGASEIKALEKRLPDSPENVLLGYLRVCITEWAKRVLSGADIIYFAKSKEDLYALNTFLGSPLACGLSVAMTDDYGRMIDMDKVFQAAGPACRPPSRRSLPPGAAMPLANA